MRDTINQANSLIQQHQLQAAYDLLQNAVTVQPDFAEAYALQGQILEQDKQYSAALEHYLRAFKYVPLNVEWHFALARCVTLGIDMEDKDKVLDALRLYSQLFVAHPNYQSERIYQCQLLEKLGLYVFARRDEESAIERLVNHPIEEYPTLESFYDYFNQYATKEEGGGGQTAEPLVLLRHYNDFIYRYPHCGYRGLAYSNVATQFKNLGLFDLAEYTFERSAELTPELPPMVKMQHGMLLNTLGKYERGFALMEYRWEQDLPGFNDVPFQFPRWRGEDLTGKRVLVIGEQGLGDAIQFMRYVPMLKERGVDVTVFTKPGLFDFMHDHLASFGIEQRLLPDCCSGFDYFLPIMSLAHYFHTTIETIPYSSGYLTLAPIFREKWQGKIAPTSKLKIGFAFGGTKAHVRNAERSITVEQFAHLFNQNAEFHCLQKEIDEEDYIALTKYPNVTLHHHDLEGFRDTAGLIEQMDLVISVDTSVAHMAAALGKTTWILITYVPDFRWLLHRENSPWYDAVRLFRQNSDYKWPSVLERVSAGLEVLISNKGNKV